jgi:hypothetical protein
MMMPTIAEPGVASDDRHDLGFRDHRHGLEGESLQRLSGQALAFGEMAFDAAAVAFGELVLGDCREEPGGGPAFLVSGLGKLRP